MCYIFTNIKRINKCNNNINIVKVGLRILIIGVVIALLFFMNNICIFSNKLVCAEDATSGESIEQEISNSVEDVLNDIDISSLEEVFEECKSSFDLFNGVTAKDLISQLISGEVVLDFSTIISIVLGVVKSVVKGLVAPLSLILVIVLLCILFNNIRSGKVSGVGEVIYLICFGVVIILLSTILSSVISDAKVSLENMQRQISVVFPVLLSLLTIMGGVSSVSVYSPLISFFGSIISNVFIYVLLPLFTFSLILSILGNLSANTKLGKLNGFVNSLFKWVLGTTFAIFMAFLSLQGLTAGGSDGISIKATKYAIKNYIPLLGGYISDGFELVKAGGMLVKNATGIVGILMMFGVVIGPILSIAVLELGLKLLSGIVEPIGDKRASGLLFSVASSLKLLVSILIGVALMYFLTIFLMMSTVSNFL